MKKYFCSSLLVIFVFSIYSNVLAQREMSQEALIFRTYKDAVVTVYGDRGHGSGFLVDSSGLILTNSHVIASTMRISVQFDDTTRVPAILVTEDKNKDIAVIAVSKDVISGRPLLKIAKREVSDLAFEGEKVIAIGSPLSQTRIVTSGIVSKVEAGAIITDVNINPGNSGGPLINLDSEVIAINTFGEALPGRGPGISGSVPITFALPLIKKALDTLKHVHIPSPVHLPTKPKESYPLEELKWASKRSYNGDNYIVKMESMKKKQQTTSKPKDSDEQYRSSSVVSNIPKFIVIISTPTRAFFLETQEEQKLAEKRRKREEKAGVDKGGLYDPLGKRLKEWMIYVGEFAPLYYIHVIPEVGETGGSSFLNFLGAFGAGLSGTTYYGSHKYEFKADLHDFELMRGEDTIPEVFRSMAMMPVSVSGADWGGSFHMEDIAQQGIFFYLPETFDDIDSNIYHFKIKDLKKPNENYDVRMSRACLEQIWVDFEPYRDMLEAKDVKLVVEEENRNE